jgi:electron transfer flavoprotein beta subunit
MMNIVVCIKVVMDPEAPLSTFRVDPGAQRASWSQGVPPVLNPYDENALEAALRIKEVSPSKIIVLSLGKEVPKAVIKRALAVGADELLLLEDDEFENMDGFGTAYALAAAIKRIGEYGLILTGRMAADTNAGLVGPGIAEILGIPSITLVKRIELADGKIRAEQVLSDGYQVSEVAPPVLMTVSHELGTLRSASVQDIVAARKKPFLAWHATDLGLQLSTIARSRIVSLFIPEKKTNCKIIQGETPDELGANLAIKLRELKII